MTTSNTYTLYTEVNILLENFITKVEEILKEQLNSIYIIGSFATGGFNIKSSDIDFLVITKKDIDNKKIDNLKNIHYEIAENNKLGKRLEGSYIAKDKIKEFEPPKQARPYIHKGQLKLLKYGNEWIIEKYVLKKYGILLRGEDIRSEIEQMKPKDLKTAVLKILNNWWEPLLNKKNKLYDDEYQVYAILSMCRIIYTLNHGNLVSKPQAAEWAKDELNQKWIPLINSALLWSYENKFDNLNQTVDFINYTLEHSKQFNYLLKDQS